ncbi:MAG: carboxypeptidase regulatory-like domain-containing protein [Deltaproteobacteria bacterium]|nr:carboxypeptidase regulatory-like domain-containing protein [Deltaproteobacteria bacterium]
MSTRRRIGFGVAVAVLLAGVLVWRCTASNKGSHAASSGDDEPATKVATSDLSPTIGKEIVKRPDPQKQARGSIAGTVRDEAKAPVAGARVCVDPFSNELPDELVRDPICKETDAQGAYKFEELYAAKYVATAGAKSYRPATFHPKGDRKKSSFELAAGEAKTGIDFVLRAGGAELKGTVSDISGGPIAHAQIRVAAGMWGEGATSPMVETDDKGAYSVWVAPGSVRVIASADGYAGSSVMGRAPGTIDVLLTPESGLSGTVVDASTGAPIEGAEVTVQATQWSWEGRESDKTDAQGKFRVRRIPPGRYVAIARTDHGYGRTEGSVLVGLGQQVDGVVVKLFPAARVVGKVMIEGKPPKLCVEGHLSLRDEVNDRWVSATTEPDGTVHADGVLPGTYSPQVWCEGYRAKDKYEPIVVAGKDLVDLTWEVEAGGVVRGKVITKSGAPIEDARVQAQTTGGDVRAKMDWAGDTSQADGSYELVALKPSAYKLEVDTHKAVAPRGGFKVDVPAGGTVQKDLVLEDGGSIKGIVVDEKGKPVDDVTIDARPLSDQFWWRREQIKSAEDGTFVIESTRAGEYRVTARRSWADELRKPGTNDDSEQGEKVTVAVGKTVEVKLVVESQTGTIKGTVVDANGQPVPDAFISSARESDAAGARNSSAHGTRGWGWGDSEKPVLTGTDGSFVVTKLSPGKYTLRAYRKGGGEAIAEHVAVGTTSAKLQMKHTGSIAGTAKRESGPMPDELKVEIEDLKTGFERTESFYKTNGKYTLHDLPAGHFTITVSAEGGQKKVETDLTEGQAKTGVDVTLEELLEITGRVVDLQTKAPVAGIMVFAKPAIGGDGFSFSWGDEDRSNISDAAGRFTVKRAPKGQLAIQGMAKEYKESEYTWFRSLKTVTKSGDIGDLPIIKKRIKEGQTAGELGLHFKEQPPEQPPELSMMEVSFVKPGGPCAGLDIKVGDVITSVDGVDVTGGNVMHAWTLMNAPVGTKLTIGLKRGNTISVTLAAP